MAHINIIKIKYNSGIAFETTTKKYVYYGK